MSSWCEAKGFYKKKIGWDGGFRDPEIIYSEDTFCEKCKVVVEIILVTPKASSSATERGTLITYWDLMKIKCPECKRIGVYTDHHKEEDGTHYSNEERRAHRIKD